MLVIPEKFALGTKQYDHASDVAESDKYLNAVPNPPSLME